ncbi:PQQ-binding-like beta-propeller repeat protein [Dactylosporangium sp. NPDC049525]|uniref:outer membrane protein assembly factor BamB family protein n=1 Tax=Dactylosporangium sp. NPDC049525 TaxID=3154730 RepID=UPI00343B45A2
MNVIANVQGRGFDIVDSLIEMQDPDNDLSTLQAYDVDGSPLAKLPEGSYTGECGAADVVTNGRRLLITEFIVTVPAAGINQATDSLQLTAWDAKTGARAWSVTPVPSSTDRLACQAYDGNLANVSITQDGNWAVLLRSTTSVAIDLRDGHLYPRADLLGTLGNYVVVGTDHTYYAGHPNTATMTIPGDWKTLGTFKTGNADAGTVSIGGTGQLAVTGLAYDDATGAGHSTVSTPDGNEIISVVGNGPSGIPLVINAYELPSAHLLWSIKTPTYYTDAILAVNASIALIERTGNDHGDVEYMALNVKTGKVAWSQKIVGAVVCALTSSQILMNANNQLATLDATNGKQLSYKNGSDCPHVVGTGLTGVGHDGKQVLQILNP